MIIISSIISAIIISILAFIISIADMFLSIVIIIIIIIIMIQLLALMQKTNWGRMYLGCSQNITKKRWGSHVLRVLSKITPKTVGDACFLFVGVCLLLCNISQIATGVPIQNLLEKSRKLY
jgi:hypothetical protein